MTRFIGSALLFLLFWSCQEPKSGVDIPSPKKQAYPTSRSTLSEEAYYDKVLGALVGSAIGDAMGASTEMWDRKDIQLKYGYLTHLTPAVRPRSAEGVWENNLLPGATTDDTRWKMAMVKYLTQNKTDLNAEKFTDFIIDYYGSLTRSLSATKHIPKTDFLDVQMEKIDWIKEWARVAMAFKKGNEEYLMALNRFYGGEMSCAGQLYTPMFGLITETPEEAYSLAYKHALFDIGYAKDISSLVSAMTQMALQTKNIDSIIDTATFIDPIGYQDSRLVGRIPYSIAEASVKHIMSIRESVRTDSSALNDPRYRLPENFPGSRQEWIEQEMAYQFLEKDQKAIAFHSGEIWQILVTALEFGEGDFEKTLQFIVNYGRDNDTVAAVAGMILGAKDGYSKLPPELCAQVLKANKDHMGIDLQALAKELTGIDQPKQDLPDR
ncbi:ADP-ribosylglycohydrolase family protein [Pseudozobellia thermophila]|uniref:ADP-ribosylglycohydrolase n=1 Tax=Pseudozobellia thermophila TaxID=192903 RepID=A0A1M6D338_9FLAO|nr:ADP-ribosylglycohydrolase family protein [Pseudozobellia thermophila]SHI67682.1 ADP-ribosylglycohydrolase [Pseudozobellia thermophila]